MRKLLLMQAFTDVNGNGLLVNVQQPFGGDVSAFLPLRSSVGLLQLALRTAAAAPVGLWDAPQGRSKRSGKSTGDEMPGEPQHRP